MSTVDVKVLFFGKAREMANMAESKITVPVKMSYGELKTKIFKDVYPVLAPIEDSCMLAVDQSYANEDEEIQLHAHSEIAIIPPLSGG